MTTWWGGDGGASLEWLEQLSVALERRGVSGVAFSMMIDPGSVTERMVAAMLRLGVVRVLVGVESLTDSGLRPLGRPGTAELARVAVARLVEAGIVVIFNSIVVHPDATAETIGAELAALRQVKGARVDVNPMLIYPRSAVHDRLCATGEARAGTFVTLYDAADATATRFAALMVRLTIDVPGFKAVADAAHELEIKVALAKKLHLGAIGQRLPREVSRVSAAIQDVRLAALQGFLALAQADVTPIDRLVAARAFQQRVARQLKRERDELARLEGELANLVRIPRPALGQFSTRAVLWSSLVLAAACGGETGSRGHSGEGVAGNDSASDASGGSDTGPTGGSDTGPTGGVTGTGGTSGGTSSSGGFGSGGTGAAPGDATTIWSCGVGVSVPSGLLVDCSEDDICSDVGEVIDVLENCNGTSLDDSWAISLDGDGHVVSVGGLASDEVLDCATQTFRELRYPCLRYGEVWVPAPTPLY